MHSQVKQEIKEVRYFMPVHQYLDFGLLNLVGLLNSFTALGILFKVLITGLSVNNWFWSLDFFFFLPYSYSRSTCVHLWLVMLKLLEQVADTHNDWAYETQYWQQLATQPDRKWSGWVCIALDYNKYVPLPTRYK